MQDTENKTVILGGLVRRPSKVRPFSSTLKQVVRETLMLTTKKESVMKLIAVGDNAPNFTLTDNNEQYVRLTDYRGKKVLLSWHPLAWTPVCTDQMRALENNIQSFQDLDTVPLGCSVDPAPSKKMWAEALQITSVKLLTDFWAHGKVA